MNVFIIIVSSLIIVCMLLIWFITGYNTFQNYIIRINEAENFIDTTLRKRFDLLNKSINIIKSNIDSNEKILPRVIELKSKK